MTSRPIDTEPPAPLFASPQALRSAFAQGLEAMLHADVLGAFVLALANASFDEAMYRRLRGPLATAFERWCGCFDRGDTLALGAAPDDAAVFERLRAIGLAHLGLTRWRDVGDWQLQFNPLRALRPPRMSDTVVTRLYRPFDQTAFHFDKPFLRREVLWEGVLDGIAVRLLYNKYPFAELHGLLVPDPAGGHPQYLDAGWHAFIWRTTQRLGGALPGLGFGYNAHGAFASVNHLHFQMFVRSRGVYPIEAAHWRHNGGTRDYPLPVYRLEDADEAAVAIARLHQAGEAYNAIYRPGLLYLAPRRLQGSYQHSTWTGGFAWSEIAGAFTTFDEGDYARLQAGDLKAELARVAPAT